MLENDKYFFKKNIKRKNFLQILIVYSVVIYINEELNYTIIL